MFSRLTLALCLGTACTLASAAPPDIKGPEKVTGVVGAFIPLRTETTGKFTRFRVLDKGLNVFPADLLTDKKATVVSAAKPGVYRVVAVSGNADGPSDFIDIEVTVTGEDGKVVVTPPEPAPPPPTPQPVAKEFRVLFVYESTDKLTREHYLVLNSPEITTYLDRACAKSARGVAEYRKWDYDVETKDESPVWKEIWANLKPQLQKKDLPVVVLLDGKQGKFYPLPRPADAMALLKTVGGE